MENNQRHKQIDFLTLLADQPLRYGIKSPDMDLYDFGFGDDVEVMGCRGQRTVCRYILHAVCRFKVIWQDGSRRVDRYYEDTSNVLFREAVQKLLGNRVKRVALSEKNDLWMDFGDFWMVFATFENNKESWRFFRMDQDAPHLIAADSWMEFFPQAPDSAQTKGRT